MTKETGFPIVGVGASAGGLEALEALFRGVPADPDAAFVIVTHLNPERESILHQILSRYTTLPVRVASDGAMVEINHVYVLPSDAVLSITGGALGVRKPSHGRPERKPIDIFLSALASDQGENAVAVILSGGDGDGTLGLKAVKERGGLTLAQVADGTAPSHSSMPNSAIATGLVDFAIPAGEMGPQIAQYARTLKMLDSLASSAEAEETNAAWENARQEICAVLRNQVGHDFAGYKNKTFIRRVQRRMQMMQISSLDAYVECLRREPKEATALFRDLLINVTNFFRDGEAFDKLAEAVVPKLFENRGADGTVRVWVPGCSTGEEVFSIAILLREHMDKLPAVPRVQIFATDIDEHALAVARAARYPEALLDSVSPARKRRFFVQDGSAYVVSKDVRDLCIFSPHSVIRDPPFSRIDLVSCRNLLIYFGAEVQNQVIPIFHYALRPSGFLFLGTAENVSQFSEIFAPVDKRHRIFRSREEGASRAHMQLILRGLKQLAPSDQAPSRVPVPSVAFRQAVEAHVLERFAPAHVVVNSEGDAVYFSAKTGKYLEHASGVPTRQLLALARRGLRFDLRSALRQAVETGRRVTREHLPVESDDGRIQTTTLAVEPLADRDLDDPLFLVVLTDEGPSISREDALARSDLHPPLEHAHLERELRDTQERLQALIEEYETALEELKSSNEELVSVNEEMQSANEELEASKEELQSLNEELHTVNAELVNKMEALDRAHNDLENLFETSQIATVFLDQNLVIRSFTPAVVSVFHILPGDRGRPLTDITSRLPLPTFAEDVRQVFSSGQSMERNVALEGASAHYLARMVPYRSENKVDGVVATFIDVTKMTQAEAHQRVLIAELNHRVKNMLSVVLALAEQTMRSAATMEDFRDSFSARVQAMARSHELLSRENWTEGALEELVRLQLAPFGLDRITVKGQPLRLKPKQALSAGMVLHELATNAGKYGALSVPAGRVVLEWHVTNQDDGWFTMIEWREEGGPPAQPPEHPGFGLRLVEKETAYNLGGKAEFDFLPEGLAVRIGIKTLRELEG